MADSSRPQTVLSLVLLSVLLPITGATPSWGTPFITADTSDQYIKDVDMGNGVLTIYEDVPIGHKIAGLNITAQPGDTVVVTQDSHSSEEIQLSFDGTNTDQNVYIQSVIDRENTDSIAVGLQLNGYNTIYLVIDIADVNDNTPVFDDQGSQISLDVNENKVDDSLLTLTATDGDVGATTTLTYSMDTGGYDDTFTLTATTKDGKPGCQLGLLKELDYETKPLYKLTFTVKDAPDDRGKTLSSSVTVFVNVQDVGDTAPRWTLPPMAASVDENTAKDTEVFAVQAIDGDTSVDNGISYSIISQKPDGMVIIDPTSGKVTLTKELDREDPAFDEGGFINIVIQAKEDPKGQPCTDITCVNGTALVTVNDLNDNDPVFDKSSYSMRFPENSSGAIDMMITATDRDRTFPNSLISLSLVSSPAGVFELHSTRGVGIVTAYLVVTDKDYLDYESGSRRHINFQVVASAGGAGAANATANVTINLTDVEEYPADTEAKWDSPFITADTSDEFISGADVENAVISIYEDVPKGHQIATLYILAQAGNQVAVQQFAGAEDILLSFNGTNNEQAVYIESVIDREKTDFVTAGVQLNGASRAYFTIQVADVNDNAPTFDGGYVYQISVTIPENHLNDSLVTLTATDGDVGATASLTYSMDTEGFDDRFALKALTVDGKPACRVQVTQGLDYETRPIYRLMVTVMDAPDDRGVVLNSSLRVFINVQDTEDAPPRWVLPPRTVSLDERAPQGMEVFTVEAQDGDMDINNGVRYFIVSQAPAGLLQLADDTTGRVSLTMELDREAAELDDGLIVAVIQAREVTPEHPDQPCTNITCVNGTTLVTVNDLDDNPPQFDRSSYSADFPSNTTGAVDISITVTDRDKAPPNRAVRLSFSHVPEGVVEFTSDHGLTPLTTYILLKDPDYVERMKCSGGALMFKIVATGDNPNQLTSYADVTINFIP